MKRKFILLYILSMCIMALSSCDSSNNNSEPPHSLLTVGTKDTNASWQGGKIAITIKANENWTATCQDWWCSLSMASGKGNRNDNNGTLSELIATVEPNLSDQPRSTEITIKTSLLTDVVKITQDAFPKVDISTDVIDFGNHDESKTFVLRSNADWSIISSEEWCKVSPSSGTAGTTAVTVQADANAGMERRAQLDVCIGEVKATKIIVNQAAAAD